MSRHSKPVVPLESGVSEENPPCPACGEPLFGWALLRVHATPVRRCELCGMAVAGAPADSTEARDALREATESHQPLANRNSLQAWFGSSGWSALETGTRFAFTPDAARRLGFIPGKARFDLLGMWQTLVNSFTFGHNLALARWGDRQGTEADAAWQRALDWMITAVTALPLFPVAAAFEAFATLLRRGGRFGVAVADEPAVDSD